MPIRISSDETDIQITSATSAPTGDFASPLTLQTPPTSPPLAAAPTGGQAFALDANGTVPAVVRQTLTGFEYDYSELQSDVASTAVTAATAATTITSRSVTLDGSPIWVEFYAPSAVHTVSAAALIYDLWDGTTDLGVIGELNGNAALGFAPNFRRRIAAPAAGSHTFSIRQWASAAGTLTTKAGSGGAGSFLPMFIWIRKA